MVQMVTSLEQIPSDAIFVRVSLVKFGYPKYDAIFFFSSIFSFLKNSNNITGSEIRQAVKNTEFKMRDMEHWEHFGNIICSPLLL